MIQTTTKNKNHWEVALPLQYLQALVVGKGKVGFNDVVDEYDLKHMLARYKIAKWCQLGLHPESLEMKPEHDPFPVGICSFRSPFSGYPC